MELDARLTEVYRKLTRLHSKLNQVNVGDNYYRQFYELRKINGDSCSALPRITPHLPIDFIEEDLENLVRSYQAYRENKPIPPSNS